LKALSRGAGNAYLDFHRDLPPHYNHLMGYARMIHPGDALTDKPHAKQVYTNHAAQSTI